MSAKKLSSVDAARPAQVLFPTDPTPPELSATLGWRSKRALNMLTAIETAHINATAEQVLIALGIPLVGPVVAKTLLAHFGGIAELFAASEQDINNVTTIGPTTATNLMGHLKRHRADLVRLAQYGVKSLQPLLSEEEMKMYVSTAVHHTRVEAMDPIPTPHTNSAIPLKHSLQGKSISITGSFTITPNQLMEKFTANDTIKAYVEAQVAKTRDSTFSRDFAGKLITFHGGELHEKVSRKTNYLVICGVDRAELETVTEGGKFTDKIVKAMKNGTILWCEEDL